MKLDGTLRSLIFFQDKNYRKRLKMTDFGLNEVDSSQHKNNVYLELKFINPNGKIGFNESEFALIINGIRSINQENIFIILDEIEIKKELKLSDKLTFGVVLRAKDNISNLNNILFLLKKIVFKSVDFKIHIKAAIVNKKSEFQEYLYNEKSEIQIPETLVFELNKQTENKIFKSEMMWNDLPNEKWFFLKKNFIIICVAAIFSLVFLFPIIQRSLGLKTNQEIIYEQIITEYKKNPEFHLNEVENANIKKLLKNTDESFQDEIGPKLEKINNLRIFVMLSTLSFLIFYVFKFLKKKYNLKSNSEIVWRLSGYDNIVKLFFISFVLILILQLFVNIKPIIFATFYLMILASFYTIKTDSSIKTLTKTLFFSFDSLLFLPLYVMCFFSVKYLDDYSMGKRVDKFIRTYHKEQMLEAVKNQNIKVNE